jgi:hypothetical protein
LLVIWPGRLDESAHLRRAGPPRIPALWHRRPGRRSYPGCSRAAPGGVADYAVP